MHPSLQQVDHRPWPIPAGWWNMRQQWLDLLFAHWPIETRKIRPLVPDELEIEEFAGSSWIGVVPFRMAGVMLRPLPDLPWISAFPELNLRLYVRYQGRSGVWFLSLDAPRLLAVLAARWWYRLPYHWSTVRHTMSAGGPGDYPFQVRAVCPRAQPPLVFEAKYGPVGEVFRARLGTLEHFLTERYCLFTRGRGRKILTVQVHHAPWPLQKAQAEIRANDLLRPFNLSLPDQPPHLLFSSGVQVISWPVRSAETVADRVPEIALNPAMG